ncbi:hypothetical protein NIES2107_28470 [Nostoc carneum NIES-2107]|nr:hypothetical protein NIES2107_28470 [Nostoc carneum NIES-2107]
MIHYKQQQISTSNQSGFTIIESLVAMVVVSLLMAAIAPVIILSVATRVQAKRIESATDAAKSYIDGVRSGVITAPPEISTPPADCPSKNDPTAVIACQPVPATGSLTCGTKSSPCTVPATNLYCVSVDDNDCTTTNANNFVIQAFRYNKVSTASADQGYQLGIRVYRANGFSSDGGDLKKAPNKQATFTGGLGDRKTPLVEMTTEITKGVTFSDFCQRLQQTNPQSTCS